MTAVPERPGSPETPGHRETAAGPGRAALPEPAAYEPASHAPVAHESAGHEPGTHEPAAHGPTAGAAPAAPAARAGGHRLEMDRDTVERDLMRLVLTIIELLRQLMERQALRRVDQGDLSEDQEERIGLTLMLLQERMDELCDRYGLEPEDLNIDLGPLGPLLSH